MSDGGSVKGYAAGDSSPDLDALLAALRPRLHRYCARMVGSAIDGEDIVQDAAMKAVAAWHVVAAIDNPEAWLFRIAHNTALDFLRLRQRLQDRRVEEEPVMSETSDAPDPDSVATSLRTFLRLPALQRSTVIMKDVLGHSIEETAAILGTSAAATKSSLQRGRTRLRALAHEVADETLPVLPADVKARLLAYVEGFRTGDFDAVRAMLADDVRLDLVEKTVRRGKSGVGEYYARYAACDQWAYAAGVADGRPAMLVYDRRQSLEIPAYFVALDFAGAKVRSIYDFLFARYALDGVTLDRFPG